MNDSQTIPPDVGQTLVQVARQSLELFVRQKLLYQPDLEELPPTVHQPGSSFVTLTNHGRLRGCIGNTESRYPLAEDVARNAVAAASRDPRFKSVSADELPDIRLEVTVLTQPQPLAYADYDDLLGKLRPGMDGVILTSGGKRGLMLPQVWRRIVDPAQFLEAICHKAGISDWELFSVPPSIVVHTFRVQYFMEPGYREPGR